ncbi:MULTISPECIES: efflux RND transporter periplasmic adaptor subunit [Caldimonas]|uniref:efflux RND transporter periplasmic adaptor subunit n=1 Tax=Caldimonas TaxID=196013 RepID=UPI000781F922|nr:efflux RND transporter periplasmic adaptor subunit [Caldimonas taiwanensis]MCX7660230.1 efflux RND transporter periplasmic adaptor subunit [Caldimonas manganoxidans]GIX25818.1 MAG: nolF secretion protein [Caldimonas sp.]
MNHHIRRTLPWLILGLLLLGLVLGVIRAVKARQALAPAAATVVSLVELAPTDLVKVQRQDMSRRIAISGTLKAVHTAQVKAKVAGELRSLEVREGEAVRAGQVLGRIDPTEYAARLRQALEQAASAQAQLDIAERTLANNRALADQGFISRNALETSMLNAAAARAAVQQAQAGVDLARKALDDTVLRAPIAGQVSMRSAQPGERVGVEARIVEIVDLSRLELEAAVRADEVVELRVGARARLRVDGLSESIEATVARINPSTQAGTRAVPVYLAVQAHPALRHGMFATGHIEWASRQALAVPESAVRHDQGRSFVLVLHEGRIERRDVLVGESGSTADGQRIVEIRSGLSEDEQVLSASVGAVREGVRARLTALDPLQQR